MKKNDFKSKCKITNIGITNDTLTGRGGREKIGEGRNNYREPSYERSG